MLVSQAGNRVILFLLVWIFYFCISLLLNALGQKQSKNCSQQTWCSY